VVWMVVRELGVSHGVPSLGEASLTSFCQRFKSGKEQLRAKHHYLAVAAFIKRLLRTLLCVKGNGQERAGNEGRVTASNFKRRGKERTRTNSPLLQPRT